MARSGGNQGVATLPSSSFTCLKATVVPARRTFRSPVTPAGTVSVMPRRPLPAVIDPLTESAPEPLPRVTVNVLLGSSTDTVIVFPASPGDSMT
ncbi:hypothetical protein D9M70_607200 [compost metagenome]